MELTGDLKKEYQNYNQAQLNDAFWKECENGHLEIVKYLLTSPDLKKHAHIHTKNDEGFQRACNAGHLDVVKYLLTSPELKEHVDIHTANDYGFRLACSNGHLEVVKFLLTSPELKEHADIHAKSNAGFKWACLHGDLDVVTYLLSFNDEQYIDFQNTRYNLDWAIENKYGDIILAMMKNLKNNDFMQYIECLPKIEAYDKALYEQVKNIAIDNLESNSPLETALLI